MSRQSFEVRTKLENVPTPLQSNFAKEWVLGYQFLQEWLLQHSTLSNSGATITNSASNGSGSGLANQHQVLHVIIIKQKSEFYRLKRHATFHKRIQSKTEKISNAIFSVSQTTSSALSNERNHLMQIGLSSRSVGPLLDWVAVSLIKNQAETKENWL